MKREEFEKLHGKLGSNVTYIDLDEQPQKPPEQTTYGWTDDMIRNKTVGQLQAMIEQVETSMVNIQNALDSEAERAEGLRRVLARKRELE